LKWVGLLLSALPALAALGLAAPASAAESNVIRACVNSETGMPRFLLKPSQHCRQGEVLLTWNAQGPGGEGPGSAVLSHLSMSGYDSVVSGARLRVVYGVGATATENGLGKVIIGYNEPRADTGNDRSGSHMLVVGAENNYSRWGGIVAGQRNETDGP